MDFNLVCLDVETNAPLQYKDRIWAKSCVTSIESTAVRL
jgi:hypothetical protein